MSLEAELAPAVTRTEELKEAGGEHFLLGITSSVSRRERVWMAGYWAGD